MIVCSEERKRSENQRYFRKSCKCDYKNSKRLTINLAEKSFVDNITSISDIETINKMINNKSTASTYDIKKELKLKNRQIEDLDKKIEGLSEKLALADEIVVDIILKQLEKMALRKKELEKELFEIQKKNETSKNNKNTASLIKNVIDELIELTTKEDVPKDEINIKIGQVFECIYWFPIERELKLRIKNM